MANLIIVSGPSASGKTTLADRLATDLKFPVVHRDRIKEAMFDTLGYSDRQRSKQLGIATALVTVRELEDILRNGVSCIVEAKFIPKFSEEELRRLLDDAKAGVVQIQCICDGEVLFERFKQRAISSERHPGHDEANNVDDFKEELLAGKLSYLELSGDVLEYETTQHDEDRYQRLFKEVHAKLSA
ncbi:MAG TPA: AAA family ATPase [Candidatus Saccharimonadales bacterium]|nr:AAA family ATPase [Candidatus Saccharimonadales bacterium]